MKTLMRLCASTACALIMSAAGFAQHYTQTNLVSNTAGVAPVTDPQLINPWGLSRASGSPWWISDQATGFLTSAFVNGKRFLYTANFTKGRVDVYDSTFQAVTVSKKHSGDNFNNDDKQGS